MLRFRTIHSKIVTSNRLGRHRGSKTRPLKVIIEGRAQRIFLLDNSKNIPHKVLYTLEGILENVEHIKFLSVTITNDLKCNMHISNICAI